MFGFLPSLTGGPDGQLTPHIEVRWALPAASGPVGCLPSFSLQPTSRLTEKGTTWLRE